MGYPRFWKGFGWGVIATLAMSAVMIAGVLSGLSPMPAPIPAAIVTKLTGGALSQPATMLIAAMLHLGYGGVWAGILAILVPRVTLTKGLGLGIFLWLVMQLVVLPFLGWGVFGVSHNSMIAPATLMLHLVYGATLGTLLDRAPARQMPQGAG